LHCSTLNLNFRAKHGCLIDVASPGTAFTDVTECTDEYKVGSCVDANNEEV